MLQYNFERCTGLQQLQKNNNREITTTSRVSVTMASGWGVPQNFQLSFPKTSNFLSPNPLAPPTIYYIVHVADFLILYIYYCYTVRKRKNGVGHFQ